MGEYMKKFQYDETKDKKSDVRNVLLVVCALIVAVTFQAGVNPPGGVWQDTQGNVSYQTGKAILATDPVTYRFFLAFNSTALISCLFVILCLTKEFPFYAEILVASASLGFGYGFAIFSVTPKDADVRLNYVALVAFIPPMIRCASSYKWFD
ncbi:uncharacterized protein LOC133805630 [Humulus lupulus]|uniref:uncharacterized protein LOC133805630 n=1 Tax=Humulus lupulus TaxID=3486 RepID=UPI002B412038|nr:uncharacterized protein LOC133805630 [Humulus lupulus]